MFTVLDCKCSCMCKCACICVHVLVSVSTDVFAFFCFACVPISLEDADSDDDTFSESSFQHSNGESVLGLFELCHIDNLEVSIFRNTYFIGFTKLGSILSL